MAPKDDMRPRVYCVTPHLNEFESPRKLVPPWVSMCSFWLVFGPAILGSQVPRYGAWWAGTFHHGRFNEGLKLVAWRMIGAPFRSMTRWSLTRQFSFHLQLPSILGIRCEYALTLLTHSSSFLWHLDAPLAGSLVFPSLCACLYMVRSPALGL